MPMRSESISGCDAEQGDAARRIVKHLAHQRIATHQAVAQLVVVLRRHRPAIRLCSPLRLRRRSSKQIESGASTAMPRRARAGPKACSGSPTRPATSLLPRWRWLLC